MYNNHNHPRLPSYYPLFNDEKLDKQSFITTGETQETTNIENAIKLSLNLKRTIIQSNSFNQQSFPLLVSLSVDNLKTSQRVPVDLVCVIDQSKSMEGEKISLVKKAFESLFSFLGEDDRLSIITFNTQATLISQLVRMKKQNKFDILTKLQHIRPFQGTHILSGLELAFQLLKARRYKNPVSSIFLLSDGRDGQYKTAEKVKAKMSDYALEKEVTIHTFGFGEDHDPKLMSDISSFGDGNFYFVDQLNTVDEAFVDCLGGLLSSVGQNVVIKVKPQDSDVLKDVKILKAYGESSIWSNSHGTFTTQMSSLVSGSQKDFLLELSIPSNQKELTDEQKIIKVATAEADVTDFNGNHIVKKADLSITLLNELEEMKSEDEADHKEVLKHFYRLKSASVLEESRQLADKSDYENAKKLLNNLKEELMNCSLKNEQFIKNLVQDIQQAIFNIDPNVYKIRGKHGMYESIRAHTHQRSNLKSVNCYQNATQFQMLQEVRSQKK